MRLKFFDKFKFIVFIYPLQALIRMENLVVIYKSGLDLLMVKLIATTQ